MNVPTHFSKTKFQPSPSLQFNHNIAFREWHIYLGYFSLLPFDCVVYPRGPTEQIEYTGLKRFTVIQMVCGEFRNVH